MFLEFATKLVEATNQLDRIKIKYAKEKLEFLNSLSNRIEENKISKRYKRYWKRKDIDYRFAIDAIKRRDWKTFLSAFRSYSKIVNIVSKKQLLPNNEKSKAYKALIRVIEYFEDLLDVVILRSNNVKEILNCIRLNKYLLTTQLKTLEYPDVDTLKKYSTHVLNISKTIEKIYKISGVSGTETLEHPIYIKDFQSNLRKLLTETSGTISFREDEKTALESGKLNFIIVTGNKIGSFKVGSIYATKNKDTGEPWMTKIKIIKTKAVSNSSDLKSILPKGYANELVQDIGEGTPAEYIKFKRI